MNLRQEAPHSPQLLGGARAAALLGSLSAAFLAERERWALWLPVAIGAGVTAYFALRFEPSPWLGPTLVALAVAVGVALRGRMAGLLLGFFLAASGLGFTAAQVRAAMAAAPVVQRQIGPVSVTGRVTLVEQRPDDRRLTLADLAIDGLAREQTPAKICITVRARGEAISPGQRVSLRAVLLPPSPPAAPGAFDFARDAWFQGIGAVGYAVSAATIVARSGPDWRDAVAGFRQRLSQRIHAVLEGQTGAVAAALTTGERAGIDDETWNALRDSGLAHIISISGLHFGLLAGILFFSSRAVLALIEPIALRFPIKKWAAAIALLGSFGYFVLAGATAPTERSFLMLCLAMVAILLDRRPFSMRLVGWAAVAVLIISPHSLLGPSFQMSFAAVVALIATYELAREPFARWNRDAGMVRKVTLYLFGVGLSTLVAGLATAPFAIYHFDRFSTYSLAANLVVVPITGLWIMPWAVTTFALMPFGIEALALHPMGWGIDAMLAVGTEVASWPGAAVTLPAMPVTGLALVTLAGLWLCLWQIRWRLAGIPFLAAGLASAAFVAQPDVLVSEDATYMAVRAADGGLWVSSSRSNFTIDTWLRRDGREAGGRWPQTGAVTTDGRLRCDGLGCLYRANGKIVALVQEEEALVEDCRVADLVVAAVAVFVPCAARVIDRIDVWREGAVAVWLKEDGIRVRTVADTRGERPWVLPRPRERD